MTHSRRDHDGLLIEGDGAPHVFDGAERRATPRVQSHVGADAAGVPATILDISLDGIRLDVADAEAEVLGPRFRLQVPSLGIDVELQRAWVRRVLGDRAECGARLVSPDPSQEMAWQRLLELSSATLAGSGHGDGQPRPVPAELPLPAWVSSLLSTTTLGGWSHHLARLR